jgi:hypothetical protein
MLRVGKAPHRVQKHLSYWQQWVQVDQQSVSLYRYRYRRAKLILQPLRRLPLAEQVDAGAVLEDMQWRVVIEESDSPLSSPFLVQKKNVDLHFCVDYGKLNDVTRKAVSHCPRLTTLWTRWLEPNGSPCSPWKVVIGKWLYIRVTRRSLYSQWVKGYGSSQSCRMLCEKFMGTVLRGLT